MTEANVVSMRFDGTESPFWTWDALTAEPDQESGRMIWRLKCEAGQTGEVLVDKTSTSVDGLGPILRQYYDDSQIEDWMTDVRAYLAKKAGRKEA